MNEPHVQRGGGKCSGCDGPHVISDAVSAQIAALLIAASEGGK
jgi:hypothetical protein